MDRVLHRYLGGLSPDRAVQYRRRATRYRRTVDAVASGHAAGMPTLLLAPHANAALPSQLDRSATRLRAAHLLWRDDALHQLSADGLAG